MIRFAREKSVKTVNIVRREDQIAGLKDHGGDVVLVAGEETHLTDLRLAP